MIFSARVPRDLAPNRLTRAIEARRAAGGGLIDLTETNPTRVGLEYPASIVGDLAAPRALSYEPHPFGLPSARAAVAAECARGGLAVDASRVVLTASTSEAYSFLFKLLCDAGDEVLVPVPSYPLFDYLSRLDAISVRTYPLEYHGTWSVDVASVEAALTPRSHAILVVSPNNPTGSLLGRSDVAALARLCEARRLALIGDEVFADYLLRPRPDHASVLAAEGPLTFSLGGLSKSAGLPQMKLGWILAGGEPSIVDAALSRLEVIADAYLSVGTPVQQAAGALLAAGRQVRRLILDRLERNLDELIDAASAAPSCSVLRVEGGWSAVVRVPATRPEETLVLELLERDGVLVHPGYFFDFPREAYLVVSLLPEPASFREGAGRLFARVEHPG